MESISKKIEDFANEKLNSVLEVTPSADSASTERATPEAHKVCFSYHLFHTFLC
jgi:symplekin